MPELNNRRIAKNAVMLTVRMLVVAIVGLYTSRIVLNALGVDDYGIYGLVGGVVAMVSFLNGTMGGATSRFITYELGKGDSISLKKVFSTSLVVHVFIALIAIVFAETVGLWLVNYKLVIPEQSMQAANIVFQFSVLSMAVSFTQVPYSAAIIAHEKMDIYAYFEIINVILKLIIVYLLLIVDTNRLVLYSALTLCVSVGSAMFYRWYCFKHFQESEFSFKFDKSFGKKMLTFSGYDLYGNLSVMVYLQGLPIVLNLFYGVVANAASTIGTTITGVIKGFSWSVSNAFVPQVTKQYAAGHIDLMCSVMCRSIQFTAIMFGMVAIPFLVETERILFMWLGQVPQYAIEFVRMIILVNLVDYLTMSNNRGIHATGNIKSISFISGSFYLACPFVAYAIMKFGAPAFTPYLVNLIMLIIVTFIGLSIIHKQIPAFNIKTYGLTIFKTYSVIIISILIVELFKYSYASSFPVSTSDFATSFYIVAIVSIFGIIIVSSLAYSIALSKSDRAFIKEKFHCAIAKIF